MNKNSISPTDGSLSVETKNLLNAFSEPVLITSNNGDIIFHNNSSSEFVKDFRNISDIIPVLELNGKETSGVITSVKHFNGDVKDVPVEIEVGKWDNNYIVRLKDVSKLVESRHKIKNIERQLSECQELTLLGLWEWDVKSNTISWSDALHDIYGTNKESFTASFEAFLNMVHPDDKELVKTQVEKARTEKKSFALVHRKE